jgi:uncharacterized glyoxalase superfamily protein PhnB
MEMLQGVELSASLTVNDLAASLEWYRDVFGFTVTRQFEREGKLMAVSLQAGQVRILLTQDDGAKGTDRAKGAGFSMQITTSQDIDAAAKAIEDRGGTLESQPVDTAWGARMFRLRDPDGFRFTISAGVRAE